MVTLIVGKKGAGKTKKLIDSANNAAKTISGNVVVIEPKEKLTEAITHEARLVSLSTYNILDADMLYGFLAGVCASNYDVQEIYVDSLLRIIGESSLSSFVSNVEMLAKTHDVNVTFSVSLDLECIPECVTAITNIDCN